MNQPTWEDLWGEIPESDERIFTATETVAGMRADIAIARLTEETDTPLSRSGVAKRIEDGAILVNGKTPNKKDTLLLGDTVSVLFPPPTPSKAQPENIPLDVIYEDADVIVINKPKGMVVHPAPGHEHGTLVSALLYRCGNSLSGIGGVLRPGIVHRIDRDTTGLIAVAKNDFTHQFLSAQLSDHSMHREYRAIVVGGIHESGTVCAPIGRSDKDRKKMAVRKPGTPGAREAVTHYAPIEEWGAFSEARLLLETGRTHQIRVHMSHIGHPVLGDTVYGGVGTAFAKKHAALLSGQALHAERLTFTHPTTKEQMTFTAPPPPEYEQILALLRAMR